MWLITTKLKMNNALKMALDQGATMKMIAEDWEFLQIQVRTLIPSFSLPPYLTSFFPSFLPLFTYSFLHSLIHSFIHSFLLPLFMLPSFLSPSLPSFLPSSLPSISLTHFLHSSPPFSLSSFLLSFLPSCLLFVYLLTYLDHHSTLQSLVRLHCSLMGKVPVYPVSLWGRKP